MTPTEAAAVVNKFREACTSIASIPSAQWEMLESDIQQALAEADRRQYNECARELADLRAQLAQAVTERDEVSGRYADMMGRFKQLVKFYDEHNGTPCEQIRHAQQVEQLEQDLARLRQENASLR